MIGECKACEKCNYYYENWRYKQNGIDTEDYKECGDNELKYPSDIKVCWIRDLLKKLEYTEFGNLTENWRESESENGNDVVDLSILTCADELDELVYKLKREQQR